ncbi:MAG TPA: hypothetical protein DCL61_29650, partial [Cyanobacteria bacterium UBA12227]|nr:hypothetical protein [Cyanobacteria bacterium UBA12227]
GRFLQTVYLLLLVTSKPRRTLVEVQSDAGEARKAFGECVAFSPKAPWRQSPVRFVKGYA